MNRILAVIVLYGLSPDGSASYAAILDRLEGDSNFSCLVDLLVIDNSPERSDTADDLAGMYVHDGSNPGLAKRYNLALARATEAGATWLLLLDQDTAVTQEYLSELIELSQKLADDEGIAGIVPKLITGMHVYSPHGPQYRGAMPIPQMDSYGVFGGVVRPFNSGALLRVKALLAIGGFPEAYWLDYLDHATFHRLQERGGEIFVMHARLEHDMSFHRSDKHLDPSNAARHRNQLEALVRFYYEHGSAWERAWMRVDMVRQAVKSLRRGHAAEATRYARAAIRGCPAELRP